MLLGLVLLRFILLGFKSSKGSVEYVYLQNSNQMCR